MVVITYGMVQDDMEARNRSLTDEPGLQNHIDDRYEVQCSYYENGAVGLERMF